MKRSLRTWLASLVLFAAPGLAPDAAGQTFRGQPHLAPVALEARCRVADGSGDSWFGFGQRLVSLPAEPRSIGTTTQVKSATSAIEAKPATPAPKLFTGNYPEPFCPLAYLGTLEPIDAVAISESESESTPATKVEESKIRRRIVGSAPMIVLLKEEYRAYDHRAYDYGSYELRGTEHKLGHHFKINLLDDSVSDTNNPNYCVLEPTKTVRPALVIADYLPTNEQRALVWRACRSAVSRLPMDCWVDEFFYRTSGYLSEEGPIVRAINPRRLGQRLATTSASAVDQAADFIQPALPILATIVPKEPNPVQRGPAVAPNPIPAQLASSNDFAIAGSALVSAADELESIAAMLRNWGQEMTRVAVAEDAIRR